MVLVLLACLRDFQYACKYPKEVYAYVSLVQHREKKIKKDILQHFTPKEKTKYLLDCGVA